MITAEVLGKTLIEMSKEGDVEKSTNAFVSFVEARSLTHLLPNVLRFLEQVSASDRAKSLVTITTAREMGEDVISSIKKYIGTHGNIAHEIDADLIGGFTAKTEDTLYDASIKNSLNRLREELTH